MHRLVFNVPFKSRPNLLAALYNNATACSLGRIGERPGHVMSIKEAETLLRNSKPLTDHGHGSGMIPFVFNDLYARLIRIKTNSTFVDLWDYARDNGAEALGTALSDYFKSLLPVD